MDPSQEPAVEGWDGLDMLAAQGNKIVGAGAGEERGGGKNKTSELWTATPAGGVEPCIVRSRAGLRCLQFVDAGGQCPSFLQTDPFPQPLRQPLTVFLVGIVFEDACFLSGVRNRFELCHGYPQAHQREDERSAVSMTAQPMEDSSDSGRLTL